MTHYRFYVLIGTMIVQGDDRECVNDGVACAEAERRVSSGELCGDAIEVWCGARLVRRFDKPPPGGTGEAALATQ